MISIESVRRYSYKIAQSFQGSSRTRNIVGAGIRSVVNLVVNTYDKSPISTMDNGRLAVSYPLVRYISEPLTTELSRGLPVSGLPFTLIDRKNGLVCRQIFPTRGNSEMIETARRFLIDAMVKYGYEGFSEDIDRTYDSKAAFFVVTDKDNNLIATARMVSRVEGENLPFEDGRRPDGSNYSTTTDHFRWSEINSFAYKKGQAKALPVLFAALGRYAWLSGITRVACLLDKNNNKTASLYSRAGFCLSNDLPMKYIFLLLAEQRMVDLNLPIGQL